MNLIVNVTQDWGIGLGDSLLVSLSPDLRHFRETTQGHTVVLGRKTLLTFPNAKPLPKRRNLILSTASDFTVEGAQVVHSVAELLQSLAPDEEVWVIGGESVYRQLLPYCRRAIVTKTFVTRPADRFFPNLDELPEWHLARQEPLQNYEGIAFQFLTYQNRAPQRL